jgi:hypothetical protein
LGIAHLYWPKTKGAKTCLKICLNAYPVSLIG